MKKLLFIFTLLFAFSISANAQDKKIATVQAKIVPADLAKKDATDITNLLSLDGTRSQDFYNLFYQKYQTLASESLSAERRASLKNIIEAKIRASVNAEEMTKIEANPALFKRLTE